MFKINVKWGKELFKDVDVNTEEDVETFKTQLYCLSNVPVDKMKVMIKGKILKEADDLKKFGIKDGLTFMMMGTAEDKGLKEPEKPIVFLEDMTPAQRAAALQEKAQIVIPAGLVNLGNTCYMNSVVQCFKRVNELKEALKKYNGPTDGMNGMMTTAGKGLMNDLDSKGESFPPYQFVQTMRMAFPTFDEQEQGHHKQQDADECYQLFLQAWRDPLKRANDDEDLIERLFAIEMENKTSCMEIPNDQPVVSKETVFKLACHIDNNNKPIDDLAGGLRVSMTGELEKHSEALGRNAIHKKEQKINKLPSYLCVNFVRFYWKQESMTGGTKAGKAKILRSVAFPQKFDIFEFCSDELKQSLELGREFDRKLRAAEDNKKLEGKEESKTDAKADVEMKDETEEEVKEEKPTQKQLVGAAAKAKMKEEQIKKDDEILYREHGIGLDTGNYQLVGVVTHKGRSADGGHYIGWVHVSGDDWIQCDDDLLQTVKTEDIMNLKGGGDWHTAYLAIYRKIEVTK